MPRISRVMVLLFCAAWSASAQEHEIAIAARASHSRFVHRIRLLDYEGKEIAPQSTAPYSPRMTCVHCHRKYDVISQGTHTRMFPPDRFDPASPPSQIWTVFDPATAIQVPLACGFLALSQAKDGKGKPEVPITTFEFATQFGGFHPGGGRLEVDREGKCYSAQLAANPQLRNEPNADYLRSRWDQSGVLEIDCLVCHALTSYDHAERAAQISVMNFKWAPTVGMGFGSVSGKVVQLPPSSPNPDPQKAAKPGLEVKYDPAIFDSEGRVHFEIGPPPDRSCLFCHRRRARGDAPWQDNIEADVHSTAGLKCVDCHPAGLDHIVAGPSANGKGSTLTCEGCHSNGRLGAPVPRHKGLPSLHLEKMTCEVCHSGPEPGTMPGRFEQPTDPLWSALIGSTKPSGPTVWMPVLARDGDGKIGSFVRMLPQWFAERTEGGVAPLKPQGVVPLFFRIAKKEIKDDNGDKTPEINTDEEIAAMLTAFKKKKTDAVYFAEGKVFRLSEKGEPASEADAVADPIDRPFAHNVRAAQQSLGAKGCTGCHRTDSAFFLSIAPVRAIGKDGKPEGAPLFERIGKTRLDLLLGAVREQYLKPCALPVVVLFVLAIALHYILFGPHRYAASVPDEDVARFSAIERLMHFALIVSFIFLAATGFSLALGIDRPFNMSAASFHRITAVVLVVVAVLIVLLWIRDMVFSRKDWTWIKGLGGYLGGDQHLPAGRFNAGQKLFFVFICLIVVCLGLTGLVMAYGRPKGLLTLAYVVHDLCAYAMLLAIAAHVYLGAFANPGTLRSIFEGKVSRAWLKYHHPDHSAD